ncbi:uncharacterized protein PRCAT00006070001 [Priceomyces carsonii]|uniref:uncharacterized protein n=1 Tax=Priceomyces carsonii TaxID=28549 RepID=UPI002ED9CAF1|nr:unnamed protein product [Priceomyces carsonii]
MSDLLSYSIMYNPRRVMLPPLMGINGTPSIAKRHTGSNIPVTLPPLSNLCLTEHNLKNLGVNNDDNSQWKNALLSALAALTLWGSLASACSSSSETSGEELPISSPLLVIGTSSPPESDLDFEQHENHKHVQSKRRQRLGPSCDACRSRKVKCTAEVTVVARSLQLEQQTIEGITDDHLKRLVWNKETVELDDGAQLVIANDKIIKFKGCKSCRAKGLECHFSKGYTKEDMMGHKKICAPVAKVVAPDLKQNKVSKKKHTGTTGSNSRKSSCVACRRRKVRCSFNKLLNKCEGCYKKNYDCEYDHGE